MISGVSSGAGQFLPTTDTTSADATGGLPIDFSAILSIIDQVGGETEAAIGTPAVTPAAAPATSAEDITALFKKMAAETGAAIAIPGAPADDSDGDAHAETKADGDGDADPAKPSAEDAALALSSALTSGLSAVLALAEQIGPKGIAPKLAEPAPPPASGAVGLALSRLAPTPAPAATETSATPPTEDEAKMIATLIAAAPDKAVPNKTSSIVTKGADASAKTSPSAAAATDTPDASAAQADGAPRSADAPATVANTAPATTSYFSSYNPAVAAVISGAAPAAQPETSAADAVIQHHLHIAQDGQWLDQLARDIARSSAHDTQLRFQLNPEHLGALTVDLANGADGASIRLTADTEAARAILTDAQPRLIAEARAQGLRISETHVNLGNQTANGGQGGNNRPHSEDNRVFVRTQQTAAEQAGESPNRPDDERYA